MKTHTSNERYTEETTSEPLSRLEKNQTAREALSAASKKGGAIVIRGRELQATRMLSDEHPSFILEGMLMKISDQVTRRAQILNYQHAGLTPYEIIKVIWHTESTDSPEYQAAFEEYQEAMYTSEHKHQ